MGQETTDFAVAAYIIYNKSVLLVKHKQLNRWLPVGGHIEPGKDPEEALFKKIKQETGIPKDKLNILSPKPKIISPGTKFLHTPSYLDVHDISNTHKHVGLIYFLKSKTDKVILSKKAHEGIRWVKLEELGDKELGLSEAIKFYAKKAIVSTFEVE